MIWIFDSWFGWLQTLKYLKTEFKDLDYLFYADNLNVPYWEKTPSQIEDFTFSWLNYLFDKWCHLVILACNTASAYSIKKWQKLYPEKKVLSITIPGIEKTIEQNYQNIWLIATQATVNSNLYPNKTKELWFDKNYHSISAPSIVELIESEITDKNLIEKTIKNYINKFPQNLDCLILWCTHYPIYMDYFKKHFKNEIIDPSLESTKKLKKYFENHPNIYKKISKNSKIKIIQTWINKKMDI